MPYQAEIIAVGTELLLGSIANTNAQFLSQLLASAGVNVLYHTAVGTTPSVCGRRWRPPGPAAACWCSPVAWAPPMTT